jgi:hypothetical protein
VGEGLLQTQLQWRFKGWTIAFLTYQLWRKPKEGHRRFICKQRSQSSIRQTGSLRRHTRTLRQIRRNLSNVGSRHYDLRSWNSVLKQDYIMAHILCFVTYGMSNWQQFWINRT